LKLGECGNNYQKKDGKLIELVLMNLRTPFDVFMFNIPDQLETQKYGKDYTFDILCGLLINDQHRLLNEGNLGGKIKLTCSRERER
jgi:hypothetical protein